MPTSAQRTMRFLSTPSARRATRREVALNVCKKISIHALREEGDLLDFINPFRLLISIHALREEGDELAAVVEITVTRFLSTPSARRATRHLPLFRRGRFISIHALREEGDPSTQVLLLSWY